MAFTQWRMVSYFAMRSVRLYSMNGGVRVDITSRWEVWAYTKWMVVWEFASHHNEKCEAIFNDWWCESWHHITMRSVRLYSMNGGVSVYITSRWEVCDYTQWMVVWELKSHPDEKCETILNEWWMVVWELKSHHDEKCETILNEWWCVSLHSGCRSQCNGCMIVAVLCCHVRREMRACNVMLQNAL